MCNGLEVGHWRGQEKRVVLILASLRQPRRDEGDERRSMRWVLGNSEGWVERLPSMKTTQPAHSSEGPVVLVEDASNASSRRQLAGLRELGRRVRRLSSDATTRVHVYRGPASRGGGRGRCVGDLRRRAQAGEDNPDDALKLEDEADAFKLELDAKSEGAKGMMYGRRCRVHYRCGVRRAPAGNKWRQELRKCTVVQIDDGSSMSVQYYEERQEGL
ncbi:hypothetical protein C8R46DRAFT_1035254 [Mycena filopes]|nr:hypothetical protein C8R46DRAFT_1035254 [Mycena filopes]